MKKNSIRTKEETELIDTILKGSDKYKSQLISARIKKGIQARKQRKSQVELA